MVLNIKFRRGRQSSRAIRAQAGSEGGRCGGRPRAAAAYRFRGAFSRRPSSAALRRVAGERASPLPRGPRPSTARLHRISRRSPANSNDLFSLLNVAPASVSRRETTLDLNVIRCNTGLANYILFVTNKKKYLKEG